MWEVGAPKKNIQWMNFNFLYRQDVYPTVCSVRNMESKEQP